MFCVANLPATDCGTAINTGCPRLSPWANLHHQFAEHIEKIQGIFRYDVTAGKHKQVVKQWTLDVKNAPGAVYPGPPRGVEPDAVLTLSEETLKKWLNQKIEPVKAYMMGSLKVKGDTKLLIKLAALRPMFKDACEAAKSSAPVTDEKAASKNVLETECHL